MKKIIILINCLIISMFILGCGPKITYSINIDLNDKEIHKESKDKQELNMDEYSGTIDEYFADKDKLENKKEVKKDKKENKFKKDEETYFNAKILEIDDDLTLIEFDTLPGYEDIDFGNIGLISSKLINKEVEENDLVRVYFNGSLKETYPVIIEGAYKVVKISI